LHPEFDIDATSSRIPLTSHAHERGPILTGLGKRPERTPAHHVDRLTGIGPRGDITCFNRTKPNAGSSSLDICYLLFDEDYGAAQSLPRAAALCCCAAAQNPATFLPTSVLEREAVVDSLGSSKSDLSPVRRSAFFNVLGASATVSMPSERITAGGAAWA